MIYRITGTLTTPLAGASLADLRMYAYKFLGSSTMQTFGTCDVHADGSFTLEYEGSLPWTHGGRHHADPTGDRGFRGL